MLIHTFKKFDGSIPIGNASTVIILPLYSTAFGLVGIDKTLWHDVIKCLA